MITHINLKLERLLQEESDEQKIHQAITAYLEQTDRKVNKEDNNE